LLQSFRFQPDEREGKLPHILVKGDARGDIGSLYPLQCPLLQERITKRSGQARGTIRNHLAKMPELANQPKADLSKGFTVPRWLKSMPAPLAP